MTVDRVKDLSQKAQKKAEDASELSVENPKTGVSC